MHKNWARARPCAGQDQSLAAAGAAVGKFVGECNHWPLSSKLFLATAKGSVFSPFAVRGDFFLSQPARVLLASWEARGKLMYALEGQKKETLVGS